jgi:transposase-like protein
MITDSSGKPKTLQQAILYFASYENCRDFLASLRWPDGRVKCPTCGSDRVVYLEKARLWKCYGKHSKAKFSLKTGTVMEDSPIGLDKWLAALWLLVNCKNGISSCEAARDLGITQKSAWFLMHRLRFVLHCGSFDTMLSGEVEADETYIGGKARNMHAWRKKKVLGGKGGGAIGKVAVQGLIDRTTREVRLRVVGDGRAKRKPLVEEHVQPGSQLYTDDTVAYFGIGLRPPGHQSRRKVCGRSRSHKRHGELLEPTEARTRRYLRERGTVPLVPLPG